MASCLIGLGSNQGSRRAILEEALAKLGRHPRVGLARVSSFHETAPVGGPAGQGAYLNAAAVLECSLHPGEALDLLQQIENQAGRERDRTWGPRTLDLDLLLYGDSVLATPNLTVPHPRMAWRRFVLEPAAEVAGEMRHPLIGWSIARLLAHLNSARPYVAITGALAAGKTHLARHLCEKAPVRLIADPLGEGSLARFYADPAGTGLETELEFVDRRAEVLAGDAPDWTHNGPAVSDFWFDQSAAFARAWLNESQWPLFSERWRLARERVVAPKLIVLLDAPVEALMERILRRGRPGEKDLSPQQVGRIQELIIDEASQTGLGPVLRTGGVDFEAAFNEVSAAMQAMG
jgi:2-amino-4-hydroxy-6-hydroxymethyldihydropteridine diphosphokinase